MSDVVKLRYIDFVPPVGGRDATHGHVLEVAIGERTKRMRVDMSGTAFQVLKQMTAQPMALLLMDTVVRSEDVLRQGMSGFEALGDVIKTGPTGNNLRDLRLLLAY